MPPLPIRFTAVSIIVGLLIVLLGWILGPLNRMDLTSTPISTTHSRTYINNIALTTPQQLLDIDDALVSDSNPARNDGTLDYERCARLHNYLTAYGWMAYHGREPQDLDELLSRPSFFERDNDGPQLERLDPALISFLEFIIMPDVRHESFFYWVNGVEMTPADEYFFTEENNLVDKERFVIIYGTPPELGPHTVGLVYDQQRHRATVTLAQEYIDSVTPVEDHLDMWYPLETILTNWIQMIRIGKVTASPPKGWSPATSEQLGPWSWESYSPAQVDSAIAAMDRLSAAIEARMKPEFLLPVPRHVLFTNAELDAASVPEDCFIRSFLTRVKTPRFKNIAPGLEVPHDTSAFAARQKFTGLPHDPESGINIPPVLIFAATGSPTINFNNEIRWNFFASDDPVPYSDQDPIPVGLYSESVRRSESDRNAEEGFRLLLPFKLRPDFRDQQGARRSDGSLVSPDSAMELFQHGIYYPFGGEHRAQRLERLMDRWWELVESGVWTVGKDGVDGDIGKFRDADRGAWRDYWIAPGW